VVIASFAEQYHYGENTGPHDSDNTGTHYGKNTGNDASEAEKQ
jgi:hypothetical protein